MFEIDAEGGFGKCERPPVLMKFIIILPLHLVILNVAELSFMVR